jgi:long-chain acyl-CoA synthetase
MSLADYLRYGQTHYPKKTALIFGERSWSYAEVDEITDRLAMNLLAVGLKTNDRVGLHLLNCPELLFGYFACFKTGAIALPINTRLKSAEIEYILQHSEARFYLGEPTLYREVDPIRRGLAQLEHCYLTGDGPLPRSVKSFQELVVPPLERSSFPHVDWVQIAAVLYTSGSTAHPKGVTHTHETLHYMSGMMQQMGMDHDRIVGILTPMVHMASFLCLMLSGLAVGATLVIPPQMDPQTILQTFERQLCTYTFATPVLCQTLVQAQMESPHKISSELTFLAAGDTVVPALQEQFFKAFGCPVYEFLGMTEVAPITWNPPGRVRVGSLGIPVEGVTLRVVDSGGREVSTGEVGELTVTSQGNMIGYWRNYEATATTVRDGWLYTGDLVRQDEDGYCWFVGRKKEIIVRGGSNISPQEVEAVLYQHPAVAEAGVVGFPDANWGEAVVAFVSLRGRLSATETELIEFVRERIAAYKVPQRVIFLPSLPKTAVGKIQRRLLKELGFKAQA